MAAIAEVAVVVEIMEVLVIAAEVEVMEVEIAVVKEIVAVGTNGNPLRCTM